MALDAYGLYKLSRRGRDRQTRDGMLKALDLAHGLLSELYDSRDELTEADWETIRELTDELGSFIRALSK